MRTCSVTPSDDVRPLGARGLFLKALTYLIDVFAKCVRRCGSVARLAALAALTTLAACSSMTNREPAPIVDATILPEDPQPEAPVVCLPAPVALSPVPSEPLLVQRPRHIVRKPVRRARPTPSPEPEVSTADTTPPPKPAAVINVQTLAHGQARGLLDAEVQRSNGKSVGRAVDAVASAQGTPREIIVNLMGFMGVGDRKVSLRWGAVSFNPNTSKSQAFVTLKSDSIEPVPSSGGLNILDASVRSKQGTELGRVTDLLVDAEGKPRAVVMDVSSSLFHDKHLIAADWSTLHVVGKGDQMHLETDLENRQIEVSPPYEPGKPVQVVTPAAGG